MVYRFKFGIIPSMLHMEPGLPLLFRRSLGRGLRNILREPAGRLSAIGALFGIMAVIQILLLGFVGIRSVQNILESRFSLNIEINAEASGQERNEFFAELQNQPFVENAEYVTAEQTYENARTNDPELIAFLEKYELKNPFPDTVGISLFSDSALSGLKNFLNNDKWRRVINPASVSEITGQEERVGELISIMETGRSIALLIILVSIAVLALVITELIRSVAANRKDEVMVEQMVGASPLAIIMPFAAEAAILLWISIILSVLATVLLVEISSKFSPAFQGSLAEVLSGGMSSNIKNTFPIFVLIEFVLAPAVAFLGSWLGMKLACRP